MKNKILSIAAGVCIVAARFVQADEIEYQKIRAALSKLAPLVGEWNAVWTFYDKNSVKEDPDPGTESIRFVLDGTYLEFQWEHHNKWDDWGQSFDMRLFRESPLTFARMTISRAWPPGDPCVHRHFDPSSLPETRESNRLANSPTRIAPRVRTSPNTCG